MSTARLTMKKAADGTTKYGVHYPDSGRTVWCKERQEACSRLNKANSKKAAQRGAR